MKQILSFLKTYIISLSILVLLSLIVWFLGPELIFKNSYPLQTAEQRSFILIFMWLSWILNLIFIDRTNKISKKSPNSNIQNKLEKLKARFEGAINFLSNTNIEKNNQKLSLIKLPWYLVIGPTGCGKSTLLANSNIKFILSKQLKNSPSPAISHSDMCDLWVTRNLVLIDVPGSYLTTRTKNSSPTQITHTFLWKHLLYLINKFNKKDDLQGILVTINLPEIIKVHKEQKNLAILNLKRRINDLTLEFGNKLPIHIIITKCDLLPGFIDFFGEHTQEEIQQLWGVTLPENKTTQETISAFNQRFNVLIKRLNKQLISKLHQERNSSLRSNIKDFPLHIERLKESITTLLKTISSSSLNIQGVYLTSGTQNSTTEENTYISSALRNLDSYKTLQLTTPPPPTSRSYFVRQLILRQLPAAFAPFQAKKQQRNLWQKRLVYTTSISCVITASIFLAYDFQYSAKQTYAMQNNLVKYQNHISLANQKNRGFNETLELLNVLKAAAIESNNKKIVSFYSDKSQKTANVLYNQALKTILIPEIEKHFENYLKSPDQHNSTDVYATLKAYIMLLDKQNFRQEYFLTTLLNIIPNPIDNDVLDNLKPHISMAINNNLFAHQLNNNLISNVRSYLYNLSPAKLGYIILKNTQDNLKISTNLTNRLANSHLFDNNLNTINIPLMYTYKNLELIIKNEITQTAKDTIYGNNVLGMQTLAPNSLATRELEIELLSMYISNYVSTWENILDKVKLASPKDLHQANKMITTLTSHNSPLLVLLDTFKINTSFTPILNQSSKLQQLNLLLADGTNEKPGNLYGDFVSLRQLQRYIADIVKSEDFHKSVFEATAKRMEDSTKDPLTQIQVIAKTNPEPMKSWLNFIAANTWNIMIKETSQYIDDTWQINVMYTYNSAIKNKYPLNQNAQDEIEIQQFIQFLGKQGTLSKFHDAYLKPFIETSKNKQTWKKLDGESLQFSPDTLKLFHHIAKIQKSFFPNDDNKLYVPFTLKPVSLDDKIKSFALNINGQEVIYKENMPRLIGWPGKNKLHASTMHFVQNDGKLLSDSFDGDWGWFKLVDKANQNVKSEKEIELSFNIEGHKAKYILSTKASLNPFLTKNLVHFNLPEHLLVSS